MTIKEFFLNKFIARITFTSIKYFFTGREYNLTDEQRDKIEELLDQENLVILTWRSTHFTSYLISIANLLLTGKLGKWSHACMNMEYISRGRSELKIFEAVGKGVVKSRFEDVFNCDRVCLLRVKNINQELVSESIKTYLESLIGRKYDDNFNMNDDKKVSCVELVYWALYKNGFKLSALMDMIIKYKNLTPQMYYDCRDFEIVYEC